MMKCEKRGVRGLFGYALGGAMASVVVSAVVCGSASAQCQPQWQVGNQQGFTGANASVEGLGIGDPDGAGPLGDCVIAVGRFTFIGDARTYGVAYWNPNAQSGSGWVGMARTDQSSGTNINTVASFGNRIIIGGGFGSINPTSTPGVQPINAAAWDGSKWVQMSATQNLPMLSDFAVVGTTLFASTTTASPPNSRALYRYTPGATIETGTWTPLLPDINGEVVDLIVFNNELYLTGRFWRTATPTVRFQVAKLNAAGTDLVELPSLGANNGLVRGGIVYNDEFYIFGTFADSNGLWPGCNRVAKLSADGTAWVRSTPDASNNAFSTVPNGFRSAAVYDGRLFLGTDSTTATPLRSLSGTNGVWTMHTYPNQTTSTINAMIPTPDGQRLAIGSTGSLNYNGSSATRFAFWTRSTNLFEPAARGFGDSGFGYPFVNASGVIGSRLYMGGQFNGIGATGSSNFAVWDGTTLAPAPGATFSTIDQIWEIPGENALFILGFSEGLRRYDGTTLSGPITDNTPGSYSSGVFSVRDVVRHNGDLVVGGSFSGSGGKPSYLMRRNGPLIGGSWERLGGVEPNNTVTALTTWSHPSIAGGASLLVATGSFTQIGSLETRVAAWDGSTWRALGQPSFVGYSASPATNLVVFNGDLYMAAYATGLLGSNSYPGLLRYNPATDRWVEIPSPRLGPGNVVTGFGQPVDVVVAFGAIWMATSSYNITNSNDPVSVLRYDGTSWSAYGGISSLFAATESITAFGNDIVLTGLFGAVGTRASSAGFGPGIGGVVSVGWARLNTAGGLPNIAGQPQNQTTCPTGSAQLTVQGSTNSPPLGYTWLWREAGQTSFVPVVVGSNGSGAGRFNAASITGATLNITAIRPGPSLEFRAQVFDSCSGVGNGPLSDIATVTLCSADFNCDAQVDLSDFLIFVNAYNLFDCSDPTMPAGCPSDINADGFVDNEDFLRFVLAYNEFICP